MRDKPQTRSGLGCRWKIRRSLFTYVAVAAMSLCLYRGASFADDRKPTEYAVKAAYLYNFGRFVKWPGSQGGDGNGEFGICVLGRDPFGTALKSTVGGEKINGRRLVAQQLSSTAEASKCQIVFISGSEEARLSSILTALSKYPVLTVSDIPHFTDHGGIIQFVTLQDKVRFEVNLSSAEQAGLNLSSELLKVAVAVKRERRPGE